MQTRWVISAAQQAYRAPQARPIVRRGVARPADGLEVFALKLGLFCGWILGMLSAMVAMWLFR